MPESPRYLVETERHDEAMKILKKLHYDGTNDDWIQTEYAEIKATIDAEKAVTAQGWLIMFQVPQWRTRLLYALHGRHQAGNPPYIIPVANHIIVMVSSCRSLLNSPVSM